MRTLASGTLVVAVVNPEGVYLAADSRRTGCYDDANKLFQLGPHTIGAIRGHAMLTDDQKEGNDRMFARHFADLLSGPLPTTRPAPEANKNERYMANYATKGHIEELLSKQLAHIEADWQDEPLSQQTIDSMVHHPAMLGLTIAQSEPDGWLLLVDVTCQMTLEENGISAALQEPKLLYSGQYQGMRFETFPPPECEALCPVVDTSGASAMAIIDHAFALTLDASPYCCAKHVGGPTDIAVTSAGVVRVVRHKDLTPPYFQ